MSLTPRLPYMPAFVEDWLKSETVAGMTMAERGLYWELLCLAWNADGLTTNADALRRLARCDTADWRKAWPRVSACFERRPSADGEERLYNARLEAIRAEVDAKQEARETGHTVKAEIGRLGGLRSAAARREKHGSAQPKARSTTEAASEPTPEATEAHAEAPAEPTPKQAPNQPPNFRLEISDPSTTTDRDLRDSSVRPPTGASSSVTSFRPAPRGGGQLAAMGLVEAWNRLGPGPKVDPAVLGTDAWRRLRDAMRRRDLAAWEAIFATCSANDYLAGREDLPAVDLWTVTEKLADRIAAGKYRTHPAPAAAPVAASVIPSTAETLAGLHDIKRQQAEVQAEREALAAAGTPMPRLSSLVTRGAH